MSTLKSIKQFAVKSYSTPPAGVMVDEYSSSNYRGRQGNWLFGKTGTDYYFDYNGLDSAVKAYTKCAPLTAIINKKAQAYINGRTWVLDKDGKVAKGKDADKLRKLLKRPNPLQTWKQFEAQGYIYQQIFGYNLILAIKPSGYSENIDATALWNIPASMLDITETKKLWYQTETKGIIEKVVLTYNGVSTTLNIDDLYIMKDFVPSFDTLVLPESRICPLRMQINNIIGAYESRNVLINYRGALGILSNEKDQWGAVPLSETDKKQLQEDFQRYGLKNKQWKFIITSATLKWQQMGYPTKELMLFEEIEDDVMRICDQYNFPFRLMASEKSNSLGGSDVKEYKKILYQDAILPESEINYEQWNVFFNTEKYGLNLDKDFSHIAVLQGDKVQEATARKTRNEAYSIEWEKGLITRNQWRVANGEDPVPGDDLLIGQLVVDKSTPLAVSIGVGGVQGLIAVLTAQGMSDDAKRATVEVVFGIASTDAARMVISAQTQNTNNVDSNPASGNPGQQQ